MEQAKAYAACLDGFRKARDERNKTAGELEAANELLSAGGGDVDALRKGLEDLESLLQTNEYDDELFAALTAAATIATALDAARKQQSEAEGQWQRAKAAFAAAEATAVAAAKKLAGSIEAAREAEDAFHTAQHRNLSAAVQAGLKAGDKCPVCGGNVTTLPAIEAADLEGARRDWEASKRSQADAQAELTNAEASRAGAEERTGGAAARLSQVKAQIEAEEGRLAAALPKGSAAGVAALQKQIQEQKAAREELHRLTAQRDQARMALEEAARSMAEAREKVAGLQMLFDSQEAVLKAATAATSEAHAALKARAEADGLEAIAAALAGRSDPVAAAELALRGLNGRMEAVQKEIGRLDGLIDGLKDDIEKADQLRKALVDIKANQELAGDLSQMLMANRFQAFMQSEALRVLAAEGSERLEKLSGGRYRLDISANGQDFEAIDQWNADDKRSVRTLSGGETFLASLALSLALAESLPGLAPDGRVALDAIFLDEGFGSLDPEALDRAAEALDSLRDGTRMVCVVTHLQELAQRMPARIVVEKTESGSRASIAT
jgi:exonuclease SbcC